MRMRVKVKEEVEGGATMEQRTRFPLSRYHEGYKVAISWVLLSIGTTRL